MSRLDQVQWIDLEPNVDDRGVLTAIEGGHTIPFEVKRVYFLHQVVADRAGHAHRDTQQLMTCPAGSFVLKLGDGQETRSYAFDNPDRGLYLPPMLFIELSEISPDAVVLVLASTHYDKGRSIRTWDAYLDEVECCLEEVQ